MLHTSFRPAGEVFGDISRLQCLLDQVFRPLERSSIRALADQGFPARERRRTSAAVGSGCAPGAGPGAPGA